MPQFHYYLTKRLILEIPLISVSMLGVANTLTPPQKFNNVIEASVQSRTILANELEMPSFRELQAIKTENDLLLSTEERVRQYFKDTPILARIAKCESSFRQVDKKGNILRGNTNAEDVGVMQINEYYHKNTAERLGYDLYTLEGNLAYAKYLYDREGSKPWKSSGSCWKI